MKYGVKEGIGILFFLLIVELQYRVNTLFHVVMNRWRWFIGKIDSMYKWFEYE